MIFLNENGLRQEGVVNVCGIVGCGLDRVYTSPKSHAWISAPCRQKKAFIFPIYKMAI